MFSNLSIKHRLAIGFGFVLVIMSLVVITTSLMFSHARDIADSIAHDLSPQVRAADTLASALLKERDTLRDYELTKEPRFYSDYQKAASDRRDALLEMRNRLAIPEERSTLLEIENHLELLQHAETRVVELVRNGNIDNSLQSQQTYVHDLTEELSAKAQELSQTGHHRIALASQDFRQATHTLRDVNIVSFAAAMLFGLVFTITTIRSITRPTLMIARATRSIAEGDYSKAQALADQDGAKGKSATRDELKSIAYAVADMAQALERREASLAGIADIGRVCSSTIELNGLVGKALSGLAQHTRCQAAAAYLLKDGAVTVAATYGLSADFASSAITDASGLVEQVAKTGEAVIVSDIPSDTRFSIQPGLGEMIPKTIVCVPMVMGPGAIVLASLYELDAETVEFVNAAAAQIGIAVSNALRHLNVQELADQLQERNELLDAQNEELQCQNEELQAQSEEIQAQSEEIQAQNEELAAQSSELKERNLDLELVARDLSILQSITAVALSSLDQSELLERLLDSVTTGMGLKFGLIMLFDEERQVLRAAAGHNIAADRNDPFEIGADEGFAGTVAQSRQILTTFDAQTDPLLLNQNVKGSGVRGLVGVPIVSGNMLLGVAMLGSAEPREFTDREKYVLEVFGVRSAIAIERARAYERLAIAEAQARSDRDYLETVIDSIPEAVVIASAPDGRLTVANQVALKLLGVEVLPDSGAMEYTSTYGLKLPDGQDFPPEELPLTRAITRGESSTSVEVVIAHTLGNGITVMVNAVPIRDDEGNITGGIAVFQDVSAMKEQQRLLEEIYEHQRYIARELQKAFLPDPKSHPVMPTYEMAAAYEPAHTSRAEVGGDFYDLIQLGDGRVGIVMADVSGKGVGAAVYTAMAKYMLRGFAHEDPEPARVVTRLNEALVRYVHGEVFVTLFYGVLDPEEGTLSYANAGHEQPLVLRSEDGSCTILDSTGPALGVIKGSTYDQLDVNLGEGDAFILYTDGLVDARQGKQFLGLEGLQRIIREVGDATAHGMIAAVLSEVKEYADEELRDDAALLVIKST